MFKTKVTIVGISGVHKAKKLISVGDTVLLKKDPTNSFDKFAIKVFFKDEQVGYLANSPNTVYDDCSSATDVSGLFADEIEIQVIDTVKVPFKNGNMSSAFIGEIDISAQTSMSTNTSTKAKVSRKSNKNRTQKDTFLVFEEKMQEIKEAKIDKITNLKKKIVYLVDAGVTDNAIMNLLNSYQKYGKEASLNIPKEPKNMYRDSTGLVKKCVGYINIGRNLMFEGDRGVGKNVLTETLCWLYNRPLYEFSLNSQHDNNSLLGGKTFVNEKIVYEKSSIIEACENGGILVLDEFNTSVGHILSVFNSLLDDRRRITVPGYKEVIAHENFTAIGTQNKDYQSTFENNEATVDRFVPVVFPTLESIYDILKDKAPDATDSLLKVCDNLFKGIKSAVEDGIIDEKSLTIRGFIDAIMVIEQDLPLKEALIDNIAHRANDVDDRKAIINMIDVQL